MPRDHWLSDDEKRRILAFAYDHPLEGYRRLTFMMLDADVVAASPTSVWRLLHQAGLLQKFNRQPSKKGSGFVQPLRPHQEWHVDVSYLNVAGTFYYLCSLLDGYSRFLVHWEIRETMKENDVQTIIQRAREHYPGQRPRIISDNGPQFIAKDFKEFIRLCGMTHVKTSPYYPQSNGKIERWHRTLKGDCIRTQTPLSLEDARRVVAKYVDYYNTRRLHSAIGYVAPKDKLDGRDRDIFAARDRKLAEAREQRTILRQQARQQPPAPAPHPRVDFAAVRASTSLAEVLALLRFVPTTTKGPQQRGPCPIHGSDHPSTSRCFAANLADNVFRCFKCGAAGNALDLWAAATSQNIYAAALDLCHRLARPVPTKTPVPRPGIATPPATPGNREEEPVASGSTMTTTNSQGVPKLTQTR